MDPNLIERSLCFHGQPMQKIWEDERGAGDLQYLGVPLQISYSVYQERQKYFTFQDRAKRLKLHQFFARKANELYDKELLFSTKSLYRNDDLLKQVVAQSNIAILPPFELLVNKNQDKYKIWRCVLEGIKAGSVVYGLVTKAATTASPLKLKPLCTGEPLIRYLSDIPIKAIVHHTNLGKLPLDLNGKVRPYATQDYVCCEVLEVSADTERIYLTMEPVLTDNKSVQLGLVRLENLPTYYRQFSEFANEKYEDALIKSPEFLNPNIDILFNVNGLDENDTFTLMPAIKNPFPREEYAKELRQAQASKWAFRSVAEGIEHFKNGNHVEAFQCLNKALNIDPRNVEGLVARGALYANKGAFLKAVDDFEKALKLNSYHVNARKYMGETLVALGRSYEEEQRIADAIKAYTDCLNIIPNHDQARTLLETLQPRGIASSTSHMHAFDNIYNLPDASAPTLMQGEGRSTDSHETSDDNSSSTGGSETDSDSSENDTAVPNNSSLSPLSKRMVLHAASLEAAEASKRRQYNLAAPFYMQDYDEAAEHFVSSTSNDFKLEEDDTEARVKRLLQDASRHKKEKTKRNKRKTNKKDDDRKTDGGAALADHVNIQEAYFKAISGFNPDAKLTENLQLYEKNISELKKRQANMDEASVQKAETPPPKAPSMKLNHEGNSSGFLEYDDGPSTSACAAVSSTSSYDGPTTINSDGQAAQAPKLSFQIRRPVKVDKFGLMRIATPLQKSPTRSRSRSRGRGGKGGNERERRSRSRSRRRRYRRSRSYSRSISRERRNDRRRNPRFSKSPRSRTRSLSRDKSYSRRKSPENRYRRRRSNSRESNRRRNSIGYGRRSRSRDFSNRYRRSRSRSPSKSGHSKYGNRSWQRGVGNGPSYKYSWLNDKFQDRVDDGPSIEEIDEIINKAQRERKQEIIKRDKDILKKTSAGHF